MVRNISFIFGVITVPPHNVDDLLVEMIDYKRFDLLNSNILI